MTEDVVHLSVVGQILKRRWRRLIGCAVLGAIAGAGVAYLLSPDYESESTILLQGAREQAQVQTAAQIATSSLVLDDAAAAVGDGTTGAQLRTSITASVVEGNVIRVTAKAGDAERARILAAAVTDSYIEYSTRLGTVSSDADAKLIQEQADALRDQVADIGRRIEALQELVAGGTSVESVQARTTLEGLRTALTESNTRLEQAQAAAVGTAAEIIGPARVPADRSGTSPVLYVAAGALAGLLLGLFGHLIAARADRRLRNATAIAEALDCPVLANVDVPVGAGDTATEPARRLRRGWRRRPQVAVGDLTRLPAPSRDIRYRRVLARLRGHQEGDLRLLVVVPSDDGAAHWAATDLAVAAGVGDGGAVLITDLENLRRQVLERCAALGQELAPLAVLSGDEQDRNAAPLTLQVVAVDPDRPIVPDLPDRSDAMVVVTLGTRTAWQLGEIAQACAEADRQAVGVLVVEQTTLPKNLPPAPVSPAPAADPDLPGDIDLPEQATPSGGSTNGKATVSS